MHKVFCSIFGIIEAKRTLMKNWTMPEMGFWHKITQEEQAGSRFWERGRGSNVVMKRDGGNFVYDGLAKISGK